MKSGDKNMKLFDDDDESSSQREYVQPDRQEVEKFLESTELDWELEEDANSTELVYESRDILPDMNGKVLRFYSTIDEKTGVARSKGSDAMRLVIFDKHVGIPVGGKKKTLRIKTWKKNLRKKIKELHNETENHVAVCEECNDIMLLRDGQYGEFYGCRNYPDCENTKPIEDE